MATAVHCSSSSSLFQQQKQFIAAPTVYCSMNKQVMGNTRQQLIRLQCTSAAAAAVYYCRQAVCCGRNNK